MAKIKTSKIKVDTKHKCLICFDTNQYFNGEEYVLCTHENVDNLGLTQDEKLNEYLEDVEEEDV